MILVVNDLINKALVITSAVRSSAATLRVQWLSVLSFVFLTGLDTAIYPPLRYFRR